MRHFTLLVVVLLFGWVQVASAQHHEHHPAKTGKHKNHESPAQEGKVHSGAMHGGMAHEGMHYEEAVVTPEIIDGVQVVEVTVTPEGYSARKIALQAGLPVRLVFTRTVDGGCAHQVQVPDFGVEATDLPLGETVAIEFTPDEAGEYTFACGMNMMTGLLLVKA